MKRLWIAGNASSAHANTSSTTKKRRSSTRLAVAKRKVTQAATNSAIASNIHMTNDAVEVSAVPCLMTSRNNP